MAGAPSPTAPQAISAAPSTPLPSATPSAGPTAGPGAALDPLSSSNVPSCPGKPASHKTGPSRTATSSNWSGYVASASSAIFTCVEATWVQPSIKCTTTATRAVVYWVGLGGVNQKGLVQVGTDTSCIHGVAVARAWHESLPAERYMVSFVLEIRPGDRIHAQVRRVDASHYRLAVENLTSGGWLAASSTNTTLKRTSAEWIVEAPTIGCPSACKVAPMPNFGTFQFADVWATASGLRVPLDASGFSHVRTAMDSRTGRVRSAVSSTRSDGHGFAVRWRAP